MEQLPRTRRDCRPHATEPGRVEDSTTHGNRAEHRCVFEEALAEERTRNRRQRLFERCLSAAGAGGSAAAHVGDLIQLEVARPLA